MIDGKRFVCDECGNSEESPSGMPAGWTYAFPARKPATHHCYECMAKPVGYQARKAAYSIKAWES